MNVLIIGAGSAIAVATARRYAARGCSLFLVARNKERLDALTKDLSVRGAARVGQCILDVLDHDKHATAVHQARVFLESIDVALICHGSLPNQALMETDFASAKRELDVNGLSVISLLTALTAVMKEQRGGILAVVTSVAGDRGRQPNFVYGAAKSMVSTYLQGLRGSLHPHGVHVVDIRPGLVDSPMTASFEKGALWSTPELVAGKIIKAIDQKRHTVYTPGYWRIIMAIVRSIPDILFKRLKF